MYEYHIHLFAPKRERLTPKMIEWLFQFGGDPMQPEAYFPVRRIVPLALARMLVTFDPKLIPEPAENGVILRYPAPELGLAMLIHERGVVIAFPYMGSLLAQIVLRITHVYIRILYEQANFWSYDPQLNLISHAGDFATIDEQVQLMESWLPKLLE
jgi:hypothetical protein